jgi:hypothetical protein
VRFYQSSDTVNRGFAAIIALLPALPVEKDPEVFGEEGVNQLYNTPRAFYPQAQWQASEM